MRLRDAAATARRVGRALLDDPLEVGVDARERLAERKEQRAKREHGGGFMPWPPCPYVEDADWRARLHRALGWPWPCPEDARFEELWEEVTGPFAASGIELGRGAFAGWGDGEPGVVRAVFCSTRHLRPAAVVETGVARGITSRFILEALEANGAGRLWSIDRPPLRRPDLYAQIGAAVRPELRPRWTYVKGSSRRRLGPLLRRVGTIDLFVHDSRHSERNLLYELRRARESLRAGGILVADDVDLNCGLHRYREDHPQDEVLVCPAEPLKPDPGRQNDRGVFGIVVGRDP
jgi:Methyltransferase domain